MVGPVAGYTPQYNFAKVRYDVVGWSTLEHGNWTQLDALLGLVAGLPGVRGVWSLSTAYAIGDRVVDGDVGGVYRALVPHTSAASGTFAADRAANPSYWQIIATVPSYTGAWTTAISYNIADIVAVNTYDYYYCTEAHTSGVFADDLIAGKWTLIWNGSAAVTAAQLAETNAETAETNAETAETNAEAAQVAAAASAVAAAASQSAAASSASDAADSETAAAGSASIAITQANLAVAEAGNAAASADAAAASASDAADSATAAAASAVAAATFDPSAYVAKTGSTMTGNLTFQDDVEGIVLSRGTKIVDQNSGGNGGLGRALIFANNDSIDIISEDGNSAIFGATLADNSPTFKGNAIWHDGSPNLAGMIALFARSGAPTGWFKANGAVVSRTTYATLDTAIYCGDANNATATWGYRTNSTDTVRSTTGTHIKLPDARGEFLRAWDDARGIDSGRTLWSTQAQAIQNHTHSVSDPGHSHGVSDPGHTHTLAGGSNAVGTGTVAPAAQSGNFGAIGGLAAVVTGISIVSGGTGISIPSSGGGAETRPRNLAFLACIKF